MNFTRAISCNKLTMMALCVLIFVSSTTKAEVYKWIDAQGITQYSDKAPPPIDTNAGNQKLKQVLDAQILCKINPKQKNLNDATLTGAENKRLQANTMTSGSSNDNTHKKNKTGDAQTRLALSVKSRVKTGSESNNNKMDSKADAHHSETAGSQFKNSDFTKHASNPGEVHILKLPKPLIPPPLVPPTPPASPAPTLPAPPPNSTPPSPVLPTPSPVPTVGFAPVPNLALVMIPAVGFSDIRVKPTAEFPVNSPDDNGAFRISCEPSHMLKDDPIVFPGQQGRAHLHTFFGNTGANYISTSESIRTTGNSTCNGGIMNRTGYWIPSMIDTASAAPLKPRNILVYYKHSVVKQIPRGLKMIAGSMSSSSAQNVAWFECNEQYASRKPFLVPCGKGGLLSAAVEFPACWDGKNLDSPDHKSHMAYAANNYVTTNTCPATHPIRLPTITVITYYPVTSEQGTSKWRLSSDNYPTTSPGGYSSHADFMMGWDETFHKAYVDNCINKAKDCHAHLLGDGRTFY